MRRSHYHRNLPVRKCVDLSSAAFGSIDSTSSGWLRVDALGDKWSKPSWRCHNMVAQAAFFASIVNISTCGKGDATRSSIFPKKNASLCCRTFRPEGFRAKELAEDLLRTPLFCTWNSATGHLAKLFGSQFGYQKLRACDLIFQFDAAVFTMCQFQEGMSSTT